MSEEPEIPTSFVAPSIEELSPLFPAYEIEAFIAQGGMGAVYKATQKSLDRAVAIKILPREFGEDAQFRSSFEAEAKAMARLNHPNLIGVYDFGDVDGMLFIIMEYVQGKALYYSIHKKAIDPTIALDLISKISRGLGHAHKGGILHRDIKPANILLDIDAEPKVGDFGLARPMDAKRGEGLAFGTPGYTAPEVYSSKDEPIDQRSDIFSVGAILFELVKGRAPEHGATSMKTGFDPRLDAILSKATHADPNQRFSNVEDFANQLDALAPKLSGPRFATATSPTSSLPPAPITELRSSKSSSLPAISVAVVALLIAGGGFAFYKSQQADEPKESPKTTVAPTIEKPAEKPKSKSKPAVEKAKPKKRDKPKMAVKKTEPLPEPKPEPTPEPETKNSPIIADTLAELQTLQSELSSGKRDQFPTASIEHNGSRFCLIEKTSTWLTASSFASKYGAQLAVLTSADDLAWAKESFKSKTELWLGASDAGMEGKWHWINGQPLETILWKETQPDNSPSDFDGENYAALSPNSNTLEDLAQDRELPFLIEWKLDGSQPGSLEQQLSRTAAALAAQEAPIFPTGTRNIGGSRFLFIDKKLSWSQAKAFAEKSGGHLAVPSNEEEELFLKELLTPILAQEFEGCWLGGLRTAPGASTWTTLTGERFAFIKWLPNQPDNTGETEDYLLYTFHNETLGHNDGPDSEEWTAFFFIEWSHPSMRNMPDDDEIPTSGNRLIDQLALIRDGVYKKHARYYDRYHQRKEKIIGDFVEDATDELKDALNTPAATLAQQGIDYLNNIEATMKLPEKLPPGFSTRINKKFQDAHEKQNKNRDSYDPAFQEARTYYVKTLEAAIISATKANDFLAATFLSKELKIAQEDTHRHHNILRGEPLATPLIGDAPNQKYPGRWESEGSDDKKVKITLNADGSAILESHGGGQGTWAIKEGKQFAIININGFEIQVKANKNGLRARDQQGNRYLLTRVE